MAKKKQIPKSRLLLYSRGEGYRAYVEAENARIATYNDILKRNAEEEAAEQEKRIEEQRLEFVENYKNSKENDITDFDKEYMNALSKMIAYPYYTKADFTGKNAKLVKETLPGSNWMTNRTRNPGLKAYYDVKRAMKGEGGETAARFAATKLLNDVQKKYSIDALNNAGYDSSVGIKYLYDRFVNQSRQDLDKVQDKPEEYLDYRSATAPDSDVVNLDWNDYFAQNESVDEADERSKVRDSIISKLLESYMNAVANQEFNRQQGLVSKPDGYGFWGSQWWTDATGTYLTRLNETQAESFLGRIDVSIERLRRAENAVKYLDALDLRSKYDNIVKSGGKLTPEQMREFWLAQDDSKTFANDYYYIQSLIPTEGILGLGDIADDIKRFISDNMSPGQDYGAEWFDYNDLLRKDLRGVLSSNADTRHKILDNFAKKSKQYLDLWSKGAEVNFKEAEDAKKKYKVSEWFKQQEGTVSDDFWSIDSWLYKQPGLMGASLSSALKSWTATALNLIAGGLIKGVGQRLITAAVTLPMSISASLEENYAEVSEAYKSRMKDMLRANGEYNSFIKEAAEKLGLEYKEAFVRHGDQSKKIPLETIVSPEVEEEIFKQFQSGKFVPTNKRLLEIAQMAAYGLGALFQSDMMATTFDDIFSTAIELTPLGYLSRSSKMGRIASSMTKGSALGPATMIGAPIIDEMARRVANSSLGKAMAKRAGGLVLFAKKVPEKVLGKKAAQRIASYTGKGSIPHRVLGDLGYARYEAVKEIGKGIVSRTAGSAISEGIEEGKQYLNAKRFQAGEYDEQGYMGYFDSTRFLNDTWAMAKSAYVMAGFPLFLNLTNDDELIANIKGGMKGGMMQTGVTVTAQSVIPLYKQLLWDNELYKNGLLLKASERDFWEKGIMFANKATGNVNIEQIDRAFDHLIAGINNNSRSKEDVDAAISLLELQRQMAKEIFKTANSKLAKDAAKANGIEYGTERYHQFVSLLSLINLQGKEALDKLRKQDKVVQKLIMDIESPYTVEAGTGNVIDQRIRLHTGNVLQAYVQPELDEDGNPVIGEELAKQTDSRFRAITSIAANIAALTLIKRDIEDAQKNGTHFAQSKRDLKFLSKRVLQNIDDNLKLIREDRRQDVLLNSELLLNDVENALELIEATRLNMLYQFEVDYFDAMTGGILGKYGKPEEGSEEAKRNLPYSEFNANSVIDDILASINEDYLLAQRIEQDWQETAFAREEAESKIRKTKLEKEAKRYAKRNKKKQELNRPSEQSATEEKNENGKTRKKRKTLESKRNENKKKKESKKSENTPKPVPRKGPELSEIEGTSSTQPVTQPQTALPEPQNPITSQPQQTTTPPEEKKAEPTIDRGAFATAEDKRRYDLLEEQLRKKMFGQLNSNLDPEILTIGMQMAYLRLKGGVVHFSEFTSYMVSKFGDAIRPYLKGMYDGARRLLEAEGLDTSTMTSVEDVTLFDVDNFDKESNIDPNVPKGQQPTGEAGDNQAAADKAFVSDTQKAAYNMLEEQAAQSTQDANVDIRTGHDYFITRNGKRVMYGRVHNYLDPEYAPNEKEIAHEKEVVESLTKAYSKGLNLFKKTAQMYVDKFNQEFKNRGGFKPVDITTYIQYLQDNPQEVGNVIEAIAVLTSRIPADYAVVIGTTVDDICRAYFSGEPVVYEGDIAKWIQKLAFDKLMIELKQIKDHYNKLGWKLFAKPVYLYTEFYDTRTNKIRRIAGETDMIAVDTEGHYHIIDFKTSYKSYADYEHEGTLRNHLDDMSSKALNDLRGNVRTRRDYYADQQTAYAIMLLNSLTGSIIDSVELLPFKVEYPPVYSNTETSLGLSMSRIKPGDEPIVSGVKNIAPVRDSEGKLIKNPDRSIQTGVLRILLDMSTGMQLRILMPDQTDRLVLIKESFLVNALNYIDSLSEETRGKVKPDTITLAQLILTEYDKIMLVVPTTLQDWVSIFKRLETLQDESRSIIAQVDLDIMSSQEPVTYTEKERFLIEELFDEETLNFLNAVSNTYRLEVGELYRLLNSLYRRGVKSLDEISAEEITKIDQLIANIEWIAQVYPQAVDMLPQADKYYGDIMNWFNTTFGLYTPQQPPQEIREQDFIEDLSEKWRGITTTWKRTLEGSVGIEDSVALDNRSLKLLLVTADPEFINDAVFELKVFPVTYNGRTSNRLHVVVHYKGHEYSPVSIHTAEGNSSLFRAVLHLQKQYPGQKIIMRNSNVHRSNGRMIDGKLGTLQEKGLIKDFFSVEYSSNQKQFAVTRRRKNPKTNLDEIVAIVPGMDGGHRVELYNYGHDTNMREGMFVMMTKPVQNEHTDPKNVPSVPINLIGKRLTKEDARLMIDILRLLYVWKSAGEREDRQMLDREFFEDGIFKGFTCKQVLSMFIPYGGRIHENMRVLHLAYDRSSMNLVHIYGYVRGDEYEYDEQGKIKDKDRIFDISSESGQEAFIKFVSENVNFNIDETLIASKLMGATSENHPYYGLSKFARTQAGAKYLNSGKTLQFGKSSLRFDLSDIQDKNNPGNTLGLSGLGYFIKRGFILTNFGGFENTLLSFDNDGQLNTVDNINTLAKSSTRSVTETMPQALTLNNPVIKEVSNLGSLDLNAEELNPSSYLVLDKTLVGEAKTKLDDEKKVRKHLRRIFGRLGVPLEIIDDVIDTLSQDANVVGRCYADGIRLSKIAERGTEYHEAFHRVTEMLLTEKQRNDLYDEYRRAKGLPIPKNNKERERSDKQIREDIADAFMYYMSDAPKFNLQSFTHPFKYIKSWVNWFGNLGSFKLFWFYTLVGVLGKFKGEKVRAENRNRFAKMWPKGLNMVINSQEFKHILNQHMYRELRKTFVYAAFEASNIDPAGRNILNLDLNKDTILKSKILQYALTNKDVPESTKKAVQEMLDNWDNVVEDVARDISDISTDYMRSFELENEEDAQSMEDAEYANIEQHIKSSYQFSQFHRTSSLVRFFFARIPMCDYIKQGDKLVPVARLNRLGLPLYFDVKYVFNSVLNELHDIESKSELLERLDKLKETDGMYRYLYDKLKTLSVSSKTNADDQLLFTLIFNIIKSAKLEFELAKSITDSQGNHNITILATDSEYAAKNYRREWSDMFYGGASLFVKLDQYGHIIMNPKFRPVIFTLIALRFLEMMYAFSEQSELDGAAPRMIGGLVLNIQNQTHIKNVKQNLVLILNELGIQFDNAMLNYMLYDKYKDTGYQGLKRLFSEQFINPSRKGGVSTDSRSSFETFIELIGSLCVNGKLAIDTNNQFTVNGRTVNVSSIFELTGSAFVSELSTYKYKYRHSHDQLSVLATKNNRFYVISENNLITDTTQDLNRALHGWSENVEDGMSYDYNFFQPNGDFLVGNAPSYGSIIYKTIKNVRDGRMLAPNVRVVTLAGFKTDTPGDVGEDYAEISQREDYISKFAIICDGGLVFPTMSDKKTWTYLRGINLPGIDYNKLGQDKTRINEFRLDGSLSQIGEVALQIWEYVMCERKAIGSCLENMKNMTEDEKVDNYYGVTLKVGDKKIKVIQGARFTSLLGVYDEDGNYIEFNRVLDENGEVLSEEDNIKIADKVFFNPKTIVDSTGVERMETEDELHRRQISMIEEVLQHQLVDELDYIESLGLIERNADLSGRPTIEQYRNVGLPSAKITALAKKIAKQEGKDYEKLFSNDLALYEAKAITLLVNDVMVKHIMSVEEVERVFSGHPAFFKFAYDKNGHLVDRTTDQHKRFGGLVSTGQNNDMELGIPGTYTQAEVDNEEVGSEDIEDITNLMLEGELRATYLRHLLDLAGITMDGDQDKAKSLAHTADTMSLEDIQKNLPEDVYNIAVRLAKQKAAKFEKGIDVADGAAYITDDMCENLLRMVGSWNSKVKKAFEILRGASPATITEQADAYNLIWTTVIGAQKYTAYGFRHQNGVQVPYYNKMALFPLFKCICTGNMAKIFNKMKAENVDVLCVKSAVKVGGQGSKPINWNDFNDEYTFEDNFHFNTYTQKFAYLRKLFNTDPKESETMHIGTQMTKVALSALLAGREYLMNNGTKMSATEVRDDIMNCINQLSDIGMKAIHDEFFNGDTFDVEKFSKFLTEELIGRNASHEMIDAVSIVRDKDGKPHFKVPLAAMSNLNFIQSILVSKINKQVVDINTPGAAFIQRSVWGLEGPTNVLNDDNLPNDIYGGRRLKMVNEEGSMDCVVSIDFYDDIIPRRNGKRLPFKEARQWLIDNGIISGVKTGETEWSNAKANVVGYRIPTQAVSSIHALRCVDVIPAVRDTVILPREFTRITGSDFDIDKLYLSRKNYHLVGSSFDESTGFEYDVADSNSLFSNPPKYVKNRLTDIYMRESPEYYQNKLLDDYISILCDVVEIDGKKTTRSMHMLHASIDDHTELLTSIDDDLQEGHTKPVLKPFDAYMLRKQVTVKNDFITGKFGIGPFALNNNNHILTMLYGVKFNDKENSILTRLNMYRLDRSTDLDGKSILAWLSGLINMHVDVAKDPRIGRLNVNKYTYNLINLMVRTGFGKRTFWFTTQPIMKALAKAYNNSLGSYMVDKEMSATKRAKLAEEFVIVNFAKANGIQKNTLDDVVAEWRDHMRDIDVDPNKLIDSLLIENAEIMHTISKRYSDRGSDLSMTDTFNINGKDISFFDVQMAIFLAKRQFDPYSEALSDLVKYSKIDTKKHGKNINEQKQFMRGYNSLFSKGSRSRKRLMFDTDSLDRFVNKSYIEKKTKNAVGMFSQIFGNTTIQGTDLFQDLVNELMTITGNDDYGNAATIAKLSGGILAERKSEWFNSYADRNDIDIVELVSGKNTIFDRLGKLKLAIMTDPKYAHLRGEDGEVNNYMIRCLIQGLRYYYNNNLNLGVGVLRDDFDNAKFITTFSFLDDESINADDFTEGWLELLNDNSAPEIQEFARDLVVYSFMVAADNGGNHDLFKYVPNQWKINPENIDLNGEPYAEGSYAEYIDYIASEYKRGVTPNSFLDESLKDDILLNNWHDDTFIKKEYLRSKGEVRFEPIYSGDLIMTETLDIAGHGSVTRTVAKQIDYPSFLAGITRTQDGWDVTYDPSNAPRFIKIKRESCADKYGLRRYNIYKLVGTGTKYDYFTNSEGLLVKRAILYPIYAMVNAKGNKFDAGNQIFMYGSGSIYDEAGFGVTVNALVKLANEKLSAEERRTVPSTLINLAKRFAKWNDSLRKTARRLGKDAFTDIVQDLAETMLPSDISRNAIEDWSKKEGWSTDYFMENILPNINNAWQIEFKLAEDQNVEAKFRGLMVKDYEGNKREDVSSESTIQAIKNGECTATTKFGQNAVYYWSQVLVGDVIEFYRPGEISVKVVCTKSLLNLGTVFNTERVLDSISETEPIMDIWSTGDNPDLSNFAERPFYPGNALVKGNFKTVEGAFQALKLGAPYNTKYDSPYQGEAGEILKLLENASGPEAKRIGRLIQGLNEVEWNKDRYLIMKGLIWDSFFQNPTAYDRLLSTGNARFTHERAIGYWRENFPKALMEARDELRKFGIRPHSGIPKYYEGLIEPDNNTVFVFGSNPEGRHGAGAAKTAVNKFGAIYGQGEGLQGNSYALPTKDLRITENNGLRSISPLQITENIRKMYEVAKQNPDKQFKVAYTNRLDLTTLNGYTGEEMIEMFKNAGPIPSNVYFSKIWTDNWDYISRC